MKKWLKRIAITLVVLVLVVLVSAHLFANSSYLRNRIASEVSKATGAKCEIADLEVSLLGHAKVTDLTLKTPMGEALIFKLPLATVDVSIGALLSGDYYPTQIVARDMIIQLQANPVTGWNLPILTEKAKLAKELSINLANLDFQADKIDGTPKYNVQVTLDSFSSPQAPGVQNVVLRSEVSPNHITINGLNLNTFKGSIALTAGFDLVKDSQVSPVDNLLAELNLTNLDIAEITSYVPDMKGAQITGQLSAKVNATFKGGIPNADAQVNVSKLSVKHPLTDELLGLLGKDPSFIEFSQAKLLASLKGLERLDIAEFDLINDNLISLSSRQTFFDLKLDDFNKTYFEMPIKITTPYKLVKIKDLRSADGKWAHLDLTFKGEVGQFSAIARQAFIDRVAKFGTDRLQKELDRHNIKIGGQNLQVEQVVDMVDGTLGTDLKGMIPGMGGSSTDGKPKEKPSMNQLLGTAMDQVQQRQGNKNSDVINQVKGAVGSPAQAAEEQATDASEVEDKTTEKAKVAGSLLDSVLGSSQGSGDSEGKDQLSNFLKAELNKAKEQGVSEADLDAAAKEAQAQVEASAEKARLEAAAAEKQPLEQIQEGVQAQANDAAAQVQNQAAQADAQAQEQTPAEKTREQKKQERLEQKKKAVEGLINMFGK